MLYVMPPGDPSVGYTQAALQYLMGLYSTGFRNFRLCPVGEGIDWRQMPDWSQALGQPRQAGPGIEDTAIIHMTPDYIIDRRMHRGAKRQVGLTVTETEHIPRWLAQRINDSVDVLVVPSQWNRRAMTQSGVTIPIVAIPHTQGAYFWQGVEAYEKQLSTRSSAPWTFYYVGTWNNRKNPADILRAYLRAFPTVGDQRLFLKLSRNMGVLNIAEAIIRQETGSLDRLDLDVTIETNFLSERQLQWLHASGDCYVSAHRGEGWGIGSFQAALCGRPVIATGWSAPVEYLHHSPANMLLPYDMVQAVSDGSATYFTETDPSHVIRWASPSLDALVDAMRISASSRAKPAPEVTTMLRRTYEWESVGRQFVEFITDLER